MVPLDPQVRKLLQFVVSELPHTEPDWVNDPECVIGRVYHEAVHLLHQDSLALGSPCIPEE